MYGLRHAPFHSWLFALCSAMSCSQTIPADLRALLDQAFSKRNVGSAEVWGEVRDSLESRGVEVPNGITAPAPLEGAQRDQ